MFLAGLRLAWEDIIDRLNKDLSHWESPDSSDGVLPCQKILLQI